MSQQKNPERSSEVARKGEVEVFAPTEESMRDGESIRAIRVKLSEAGSQDYRQVVINLAGVKHLSAACIRELIALQRQLQNSDAELILCEMLPSVSAMLETTGVGHMFTIYKNEEGALSKSSQREES